MIIPKMLCTKNKTCSVVANFYFHNPVLSLATLLNPYSFPLQEIWVDQTVKQSMDSFTVYMLYAQKN
jgi:hypothetical protein